MQLIGLKAMAKRLKLKNNILVIKCGGSILQSQELTSLIRGLRSLQAANYKLILVHGGGPEINELSAALKIESNFVNGLRITCDGMLSIIQMALIGKVNINLVGQLNQSRLPAIGLSGHDVNLLKGKFINRKLLGYVGEIIKVQTELIELFLDKKIMPVIAPLAVSVQGETLNINADTAAATIAAAVGASHLILLSNINGYYAQYPDPQSIVPTLTSEQIATLLASGQVIQGMHPKLTAARNAVNAGVQTAYIINGKQAFYLLQAIQKPGAIGTCIIQGEA